MNELNNSVPIEQQEAARAETRANDLEYLVCTLIIYVLFKVFVFETMPYVTDFCERTTSFTVYFFISTIPVQACQLLILFFAAKKLFPTGESTKKRLLLTRPENLTKRAFCAWIFLTIVITTVFCNLTKTLLEAYGCSMQEQFIMRAARDSGYGGIAILLASSVIFAPVIEEVFFRHILYGNLRLVASKASSAVLASMIFSAVHFSLSFALPLFVLGLLLQLIRMKSCSVIPGIIIHAAFNFMNIFLLALDMAE